MKRLTFAGGICICVATLAAGAVFAKPETGHVPLRFEQLDIDKNGQIDASEIQQVRKNHLLSADADGDGTVSLDELKAKASTRAETRMEKFMERADTNGDGVLSDDELTTHKRAGHWFDRVDTDGDGAISEAEFDAARAKMSKRGPKSK